MASDSEVSICNGALLLLGAKPIGSIDNPETDKEQLCAQFYSSTRNTALQAYPWNFAVKRVALTKDASAPAYGFSYQYDLPNNPYCLRVLRAHEPEIVFRIEGRKLLSDNSAIKIKYIARITSVAEMSAMFREAFEHLMAWKLCYGVTGSTSLRKDLMASYKEILIDAEDIDTQEGVNDPDEEYGEFNDLLDVRIGGGIGRSHT